MNIQKQLAQHKTAGILILTILVAVILRISGAIYLGDAITVKPAIYDEFSYDTLAQSLISGRGFSFPVNWYPFTPQNQPTAHWSFYYPLYLAITYKLFGYHPIIPRLIQAVIASIFGCWLLFRLGKRLFNTQIGLISAGIGAVYAYFVYYNAALLTETFYILFLLAALDLSYSLVDKPSITKALLLGLTLAFGSILRQVLLLFIPFLFLWIAWAGKGKIKLIHFVLPVIVLIVMIAPWTVRNYRVYGRFLLLNSNVGYAFYTANHPHHGNNYDWKFVAPIPSKYKNMNEAEINNQLMIDGIRFILNDPVRYIRLSISMVDDYFNFLPSKESPTISNASRLLSFTLFLPFMIFGLYLSFRDWKKYSLLYLFMLIYSAIHILSWPGVRYRLPVDAVLIVFAANGIYFLFLLFQRRTKGGSNQNNLQVSQ